MNSKPLITVVVPSYNQGRFLECNLESIFAQDIPVEVFVIDGGSDDCSLEIIKKYEHKLAGWRSHPDNGQSAAINEGVKLGTAPYVCWLNSDDFFYPNGLKALLLKLEAAPLSPFAYGRCWTTDSLGRQLAKYLTLPFIPYLFANYCFICQPGTLIRRSSWEQNEGLNEQLQMAMDYDLWWRLFKSSGKPIYIDHIVAATRTHNDAKTLNNIDVHYLESKKLVRRYWGRLPLKWYLSLPLMKIIRRIEKISYRK
ncbi:glycosyltransferase family 2 protein, partial [Shewanella algidipiscicola]